MSDQAGDAQGPNSPPAAAIRAQVDRMLRSPEFAQSDRLQMLLRYIVEETLADRSDRLKEYSIALEVFERDESFDPQTSSIVRVEASRLRGKLREYYASRGSEDSVHVVLPAGSYVPVFTAAAASASGPVSVAAAKRAPVRAAVLVAAAVVVAASTLVLWELGYFGAGGDGSPVQAGRAATYTIAVLPLRNLSGKSDEDYFSDGMTNALITSLAKQDSVRVISLTSAMAYKNVNRPIADIARELNVDHIIEGAVVRSGDRVRISAQLIEAATDQHLWAESYERELTDVLAIQDDVVRRIITALRGEAAMPGTGPGKPQTLDPVAHELYLRGLHFRNQMTEEGYRKGIDYFEQAIARDKEYAAAYSGMATCFCLLGGFGFEMDPPSESMPVAKAAVLEALRLDETLAEPHAFLGIIRLKYEWDWPGAEEAFKRSIALNRSYAQARLFYSFFLEAMGRQQEAIRQAEEAKALDPLSLAANVNLGWQYLRAGRREEARSLFDSTAELAPDFWGVHWGLGHYHRARGDYGAAVVAFQKAVASGGGYALPLTELGYTLAASGQTEAAREVLDRLEALDHEGYVSPFNMALVHAGLGDKEQAFAWLERAFRERSRSMAWLKVARELDGLRSDPRFDELLRRVGHTD